MTSATLDRPAAPAEAPEAPRGRKKLIAIGLVLVVAAAAGWWFFLKPGAPAEPEPGEVMTMEPIQVNLADGHYLRVGIALQLSADAHEAEGSKALDATIDLFSGRSIAEIEKAEERHELKEKLTHELKEAYDDEVMGVYFTEFVTQ